MSKELIFKSYLSRQSLEELVSLAVSLGANDVSIIKSSDIIIDTKLAESCKGEGSNIGCSNYGMSLSCPPNVLGPSWFKRWRKNSTSTIVVRVDVPQTTFFSSDRLEIMKLLHEIVASVELSVIKKGYCKSMSFAGGSCKDIFCYDYVKCIALDKKEDCRNSELARPSMSGFGVNVNKLMGTAGWHSVLAKLKHQKMMWITGIILIAK